MSDWPVVRLECHTGQAYTSSALTSASRPCVEQNCHSDRQTQTLCDKEIVVNFIHLLVKWNQASGNASQYNSVPDPPRPGQIGTVAAERHSA